MFPSSVAATRARPPYLQISIVLMVMVAAAPIAFSKTENLAAVLLLMGVGGVCAALMIMPKYWLMAALIAFVPFHQLLSVLFTSDSGDPYKIGVPWEFLVAIGILRSLTIDNLSRLFGCNRWTTVWSALLLLAYCVGFLRNPSVPAIYALSVGVRYIGVLWFFMLVDLEKAQMDKLFRLMLWSVGLIAVYGLVQYFWDYDRFLPYLATSVREGFYADSARRLYSYSFNVFEPAFTSLIAILLLSARVVRYGKVARLCWIGLFTFCLLLTYTRSAYVGLVTGVVVLCSLGYRQLRRPVVAMRICFGLCLATATCWILIAATGNSSVGQRVHSIISQHDESSIGHKESILNAMRDVADNPLGSGLGNSGAAKARFGSPDDTNYVENWILNVADEAGLVAAFAYIGLTCAIIWSLVHRRRDKENRELATGALATIISLTVISIAIQVWTCETTCVYAWALIGMALTQSAGGEGVANRDRLALSGSDFEASLLSRRIV